MDNNNVTGNLNNNQNNNMALISMILGIISVVLCWVPVIGLALGVVAVVFFVKGLKIANEINKGKGFAIAGISCGAVGIVLNVIYTIIWLMAFSMAKYTVDEITKYNYNSYNYNTYRNTYQNRTYDYNSINSILNKYKY